MTLIRWVISAAGVCMIMFASQAAAQQDIQQRVDQQLEQIRREARLMPNTDEPAGVRLSLDYGLYLTTSFFQVDDADVRQQRLQEDDLTLYAHANLDNVQDIFVREVTTYRDERPLADGDKNGWDARFDRLYYRYDLTNALAGKTGQVPDAGLAMQVGRDLQYWGTGLTLARELDSFTLDLTYKNQEGLRLLAGTTPRDTIDIDTSRPGFQDHTNRDFFGALASLKAGNHRPFAYVLVQRDHNPHAIKTGSASLIGGAVDTDDADEIITEFDYNSVYWGIGSTGALSDRLAYGVEATLETGTTLSRNPAALDSSAVSGQTRDDIEAFAANVQLDYLFGDAHNSRLSASFIYGSGDRDRLNTTNTFNGNAPGTKDHSFNAFGQLNTGLDFDPTVSNLICLRGGGSFFPFTGPEVLSHLQTGVDCFGYFKAVREGGVDEASDVDHYLGFESDVYLNWQVTSDLTFAARYGRFWPGSGLVADDKARNAFFVSMTVSL